MSINIPIKYTKITFTMKTKSALSSNIQIVSQWWSSRLSMLTSHSNDLSFSQCLYLVCVCVCRKHVPIVCTCPNMYYYGVFQSWASMGVHPSHHPFLLEGLQDFPTNISKKKSSSHPFLLQWVRDFLQKSWKQKQTQKKTQPDFPIQSSSYWGSPHDSGSCWNPPRVPRSTSGNARVARCTPASALKLDGRLSGPKPTKLGSSCTVANAGSGEKQ